MSSRQKLRAETIKFSIQYVELSSSIIVLQSVGEEFWQTSAVLGAERASLAEMVNYREGFNWRLV
jgi:hypothetical protein